MVTRLVLGYGEVGQAVVERLRERNDEVRVVTDSRTRVSTLRNEGVDAVEADPTDADAYPEDVASVVVAGESVETNARAARIASERYPSAFLLAYPGDDADDGDVAALKEMADRVVDPRRAIADRVLRVAASRTGERVGKLLGVLRDVDGPLAVVAHDNPDPDAIASAIALAHLAEHFGVEADPCYFGDISHQENRALVNLLDISLRDLDEGGFDEYGSVALVDHSRPGVNDSLPEETFVDVVVDHHPPRAPVEARYVDLRSEVGATSTILGDYFDTLGVDLSPQVATALLYGIRIDTRDFTRETDLADFEVASRLIQEADTTTLDRIESPSMSPETLSIIGRAIRGRDVRGDALATCVGEIRDRDAIAQAADQLLDMEGIHTVVVYGFMDGTIYASARARGADLDLGETLRDALGQIGSAGGHADMAGAQIPLGILGDVDEESTDTLRDIVHEVVSSRFFETLEDAPSAPRHDDEMALELRDSGGDEGGDEDGDGDGDSEDDGDEGE